MHFQLCNYLIHKESVYCLIMTTTYRVNDEDKDRLCVACEIEPLNHNSDSWCSRCKWMIHPHCSGTIPLHESSREDREIVNDILQNHSRRSTIGRIREWHDRLDREDSEWLLVSQKSHLQSIVDDQKANEIRTRIIDQIKSTENQDIKERLMNRGFPLPGGCWLQISSCSSLPPSITIDGIINTGVRIPDSQLIELISKMEDWELKAVNWHRLAQLLAQLGETLRDRWKTSLQRERQVHPRWRHHFRAARRRNRSDFKTIAAVISKVLRRWTLFSDKSNNSFEDQQNSLETLPFYLDSLPENEIFSIPWLRRWREITNNWSNPELLNHEYNSLITVRNGRLFLRVEDDDGKMKLRRIPSDIHIISAIISAQLSPPGTSIHDTLQLLLSNWENDEVTLKIPNDADRKAARLLRDIEHHTENINFSENERSLLIQGTTSTEYRIKINRTAKNLVEDKFQLSARTNSSEPWGKICTHASDELRDLPIGDQIVTLALICSNDRENNTAIATIHNFLVIHGKIPRNPEIFQDHFQPPIPLRDRVRDYFDARNLRDNNIRRRHQNPPYVNWGRLVENEWNNQEGEFRFEREHQFPINDATLGDGGNRNRIPNILINAMVAFNAAPIGALARLPIAPGGIFGLLTIENQLLTQQEVEVLQSIARIHGWVSNENNLEILRLEENQQIWVKERHLNLNEEIRNQMYELLAPIQEEIDPNGRPWWARIEDRVRYFRQLRHNLFWNFQNEER